MDSIEQQNISMRLINRLNEPLQSKRPKYVRSNLVQSTGKYPTEYNQTNPYHNDKFYLRKTYRINYSENQNYKYFNNEPKFNERERSRIKFIKTKTPNKQLNQNNWNKQSKSYKAYKYNKRDNNFNDSNYKSARRMISSKKERKSSTMKCKDKGLPESPHNTSQFLVSNFPSSQLLKIVLGNEDHHSNHNLRQFNHNRSKQKQKNTEMSQCSRPISPSVSTRRKLVQSDSNLSFELNNLELTSKIKPGGTMMGLNINRIKKNLNS